MLVGLALQRARAPSYVRSRREIVGINHDERHQRALTEMQEAQRPIAQRYPRGLKSSVRPSPPQSRRCLAVHTVSFVQGRSVRKRAFIVNSLISFITSSF